MSQSREVSEAREPTIFARELFAFQQQREPIFEVEADDIRHASLFLERLGHRGQFQMMQQIGGLLGEHD